MALFLREFHLSSLKTTRREKTPSSEKILQECNFGKHICIEKRKLISLEKLQIDANTGKLGRRGKMIKTAKMKNYKEFFERGEVYEMEKENEERITRRMDINAMKFSPEVLVFAAIEKNEPTTLETILSSHTINFTLTNSSGTSPLHLAVIEGNTECVESLLRYGADVNIRDAEDWTPLHTAVCAGHFDCVKLLVESGANLNAESVDGLIPVDLIYKEDEDVVEFMHKVMKQSELAQSSPLSS